MKTELRTADAGVPAGTGDEKTDHTSGGGGDAVVVAVDTDGARDDLEWRVQDHALRRPVLGRRPQWMHAYSGCSHRQGDPPRGGRTGMSPTPVDACRGLATGDVST